jgi:hypothetical protein
MGSAATGLPEGQRSDESKALVGLLSRREQRQVAKLVSQNTNAAGSVEDQASSWLGLSDIFHQTRVAM